MGDMLSKIAPCPSEKPPCPSCNSTDAFAFPGLGDHLCKSCCRYWSKKACPSENPEEPPCPSCNSTDALARSRRLDRLLGYRSFRRPRRPIDILDQFLPSFTSQFAPPPSTTTASPLGDSLQTTRTSPSNTQRSALGTGTDAGPGLGFDESSDQSQALQATDAEASGSAEIRSAFNEPDGVPERRYIGVPLPRGTYAAETRLERNGHQVLLGTFGTAEEAAYATKPNVSVNATTIPNRVSSGEVIGLAHRDSDDIEGGRLSDHVRSRPRWAIVVDPLFDVNVQGAFTLVAFKTSNGSSPAKDVLLYVLGFVYMLGFLSAVGGKLFRSFKMQLIGWVAAALGFLLTMALLLV